MPSLVQFIEGHSSTKFTSNHFIHSKSVFLKLYPTETSVFDNQVSAKKGTNIDTLLENIILVAEVNSH